MAVGDQPSEKRPQARPDQQIGDERNGLERGEHTLNNPRARAGALPSGGLIEQQELYARDLWPRDGISLHTANPHGRDTMARTIHRYAGKLYRVRESRAGGQPRFRFEAPGL